MAETNRPKTALVTGANGYIGRAVALSFVRAGWTVYGLVRSTSSIPSLARAEIIPIHGSPVNADGVLSALRAHTHTLDVIITATEQWPDYEAHFADVVHMLHTIALASNAAGTRPLVLFSSGCKDYGRTGVHGAPGLAPHTEESRLDPPEVLAPRTRSATMVFEHTDLFDAALLRPTNVYGGSGSLYGVWFELGAKGKENGVLKFTADPGTVLHALHVDDCGEAYVALAEPTLREKVSGRSFNISAHQYETLRDIGEALAKEYRIEGGVQFVDSNVCGDPTLDSVVAYSQWVSSQKLRELTGWEDRRQLFSKGLPIYRLAYEAASQKGWGGERIDERMQALASKSEN